MIESKCFIEAEVKLTPSFLLADAGVGELERNIHDWLSEQFAFGFDESFGRAFRKRCPIPHVTDEDYLFNVVEQGDHKFILSLRFIGQDVRRPFVELVSTTFQPMNSTGRSALQTAIHDRYGELGVTMARRFVSREEFARTTALPWRPGSRQHGPLKLDRVVFSRNENTTLGQSPVNLREFGLGVKPVASAEQDELYDKYREEYSKLANVSSVHRKGRTWFRQRERVSRAVDQELAFKVVDLNGPCGLIVFGSGRERFLRGYYFSELFLFERVRGKGFGTEVQRRAIQLVTQRKGSLTTIYGHIDPANTAAIRTAKACGRRFVGAYAFERFDVR